MAAKDELGREFIQSVERAFTVLRSFTLENPKRTISQVAEHTGLTRAASRRFLLTFEALGYVKQVDGDFSLTPKVLDIAYAYINSLNFADVAEAHMEELVSRTEESSSIATLEGTDVVYVVRVPTRRIMTVALTVGSRLPAYATSLGRVLLAGLDGKALDRYFSEADLQPLTPNTVTSERELRGILDGVRDKGWALVDEELEKGIRSIAAPIHDSRGVTIAAINLGTPAGRVTMSELKSSMLPLLLETARAISGDLSERPR